MSTEQAVVSFSYEINIEPAYTETRKLQTMLYQTLSLVRRASGDEDLDRFIAKAQRAIAIANKLRLTLAALQAARMATGDPLAWGMFGITAATTAYDVADMALEM